jgi:hypothetical protein
MVFAFHRQHDGVDAGDVDHAARIELHARESFARRVVGDRVHRIEGRGHGDVAAWRQQPAPRPPGAPCGHELDGVDGACACSSTAVVSSSSSGCTLGDAVSCRPWSVPGARRAQRRDAATQIRDDRTVSVRAVARSRWHAPSSSGNEAFLVDGKTHDGGIAALGDDLPRGC